MLSQATASLAFTAVHQGNVWSGNSGWNSQTSYACTQHDSGYAAGDQSWAKVNTKYVGDGWYYGSWVVTYSAGHCASNGLGSPDDVQGVHRVVVDGVASAVKYT